MKKIKLMMIVSSLNGGGSERVMSTLANHIDRDRFEVSLVLLRKEGIFLKDLKDDIKLIDLKVKKTRYAIVKLYQVIKTQKPDVVFSTMGTLNVTIGLLIPLFKNIRFIARESSIPSMNRKVGKYVALHDFLYRRVYNKFDMIVCQSHYMKKDLIKNYDIDEKIMVTINNPVDIEKITKLSDEKLDYFDKNKVNLLAVGRLSKVKGYDLLFETFSKLENKYHLSIIGAGSQEQLLKSLSKDLGINDRVTFLGFQSNPYNYMKQTDYLILSSRHEGFPNVVLEANACGTPVVAFECPGGISEIIENGINGILVENGDTEKLAEAIDKTKEYHFDRDKIVDMVKKRYSLSLIIDSYEKAIEKFIYE
jgi:glycosyltransferase involved in cell wall biosynthesis